MHQLTKYASTSSVCVSTDFTFNLLLLGFLQIYLKIFQYTFDKFVVHQYSADWLYRGGLVETEKQ